MCPATDNRQFSCHVIARRPAGPTWARHQPSGLPNARSACVRLQSVFPAQRPAGGSGPYLALPLGELSPKVTERACWGFWFLPTVVPAGWPALSCPPAGALPRNRLASSATGGASAICPLSRLRRQLPQRGSQAAGASAFRGGVAMKTYPSSRLSALTPKKEARVRSSISVTKRLPASMRCTVFSAAR